MDGGVGWGRAPRNRGEDVWKLGGVGWRGEGGVVGKSVRESVESSVGMMKSACQKTLDGPNRLPYEFEKCRLGSPRLQLDAMGLNCRFIAPSSVVHLWGAFVWLVLEELVGSPFMNLHLPDLTRSCRSCVVGALSLQKRIEN